MTHRLQHRRSIATALAAPSVACLVTPDAAGNWSTTSRGGDPVNADPGRAALAPPREHARRGSAPPASPGERGPCGLLRSGGQVTIRLAGDRLEHVTVLGSKAR